MSKNSDWQFHFVVQVGDTTEKVNVLGANAPLRVTRENLPVGSVVGPAFQPSTVQGPYLKVEFGVPKDVSPVFAYGGRIKILKKTREYCHDVTDSSASIVFDGPDVGALGYNDSRYLLDQDIGDPGTTWYYTIFYENTVSGKWAFSPAHGFVRNWAYQNRVGENGEPESKYADVLYEYLPPVDRKLDWREANEDLKRLTHIFGRIFDMAWEDIEQTRKRVYDPDNTDAANIPYIDQFLGWPTNFELSSQYRRRETKQAVELWKKKGSIPSLEFALQALTGWAVTVTEGYPWVLRTHDGAEPVDKNNPPAGWNALTDGVWADVVNSIPKSGTFDPNDPSMVTSIRNTNDGKTFTFSNQIVSSNGVGWPWQNTNGLYIELHPVPDQGVSLPEVVIQKMAKMAPLFVGHYATYTFNLSVVHEEEYAPLDSDAWVEEHVYNETLAFDELADYALDTSYDKMLLYTYPHPKWPLVNTTNDRYVATWHSWLVFSEPDPYNNVEIMGRRRRELPNEDF